MGQRIFKLNEIVKQAGIETKIVGVKTDASLGFVYITEQRSDLWVDGSHFESTGKIARAKRSAPLSGGTPNDPVTR